MALATIVWLLASTAQAEDWPHWMGPTRDNVWHETGLLEKFPASGPRILWRTAIAGGYAGPAVVGDNVFVSDYATTGGISQQDLKVENYDRNSFNGVERVHCLDAHTGQVKWSFQYPVRYSISYPTGPRCTPTVDQGKVYTLGAEGHLLCFDAENGKVLWYKDFTKQYDTKTAVWGYASHPLIDGQKLICIVGGAGSHVVAFDKNTGRELWRALTSPEQGYAPPTIIEAQGVRQLILFRPDAVTSVDPETGHVYWSVPYQAESGLVCMSPIYWNGYLYLGGYPKKTMLLRMPPGPPAAEIVWADKFRRGLSPVNVQPFQEAGILYGIDHIKGEMMAVELVSGKRLWKTFDPLGKRRARSGTVFLVKQADRFWMFNEHGEIIIAKLSPQGYQEIDRQQVIEPTDAAFGRDVVWCMPAFAGRRMFVRNGRACICVDLAAR